MEVLQTSDCGAGEPWTLESVDADIRRFREIARDNFNRDGYVSPVSFVFASCHPKTQVDDYHSVIIVPAVGNFNEETKERYSAAIRKLVRDTKAVAVAFLSEIWSAEALTEAESVQWRGRLDQHPRRKELLLMSYENVRRGTQIWTSEIVREADSAKAGDWALLPSVTKTQGRFVGLLREVS